MNELTVIGTESDALLLEGASGEKFKVTIDESLRSALRAAASAGETTGTRLSPREIQSHIRAGMSASDVAAISGAPLEYIEKFEGPVLAEREYMIESAREVPVTTAADAAGETHTFGSVIDARLAGLGASGVRWASWKEPESGWIIKLAFTADSIDHDARWSFDPRKSTLAPVNNEATTLSQQGDLAAGLVPRLRAVAPESPTPDASRFDSGAFRDTELGLPDTQPHPGPAPVVSIGVQGPSVPIAGARGGADEASGGGSPSSQTADLLDALRRRRGEREAANFEGDDFGPASLGPDGPEAGPGLTILDIPLDNENFEHDEPEPEHSRFAPPPAPKSRKGRVAMPSWDEIVFGAKPDDDPA